MPAGFHHVAVVAAIYIAAHASTPVGHLKGGDGRRARLHSCVPTQLMHGTVPFGAQQVGGLLRGNHVRAGILEPAQTGQIEMVHVGMREEHQINRRQFLHPSGNLDEAFYADRERAEI